MLRLSIAAIAAIASKAAWAALAISSLASGSNTSSNPASTASVNPTSGSVTYLFVGYAVEGGGTTVTGNSVTPSGARGTWTTIAHVEAQTTSGLNRRGLFLVRGTGSVTNEAISITVNITGPGNVWTETMWSVIEVTGQDATPDDTPVKNGAVSGTTSSTADVGTVDAGDAVIFGVIHETNEAVSATGWTSLAEITGGTDIRTLHTYYDDSSPDETPNATWASSGTWGSIAFVVNAAAGGGGSAVPIILQQMGDAANDPEYERPLVANAR